MSVTHQSDARSLEPNAEGWYSAICECGWSFGPLPDRETVCDALMEHAAGAGKVDAAGLLIEALMTDGAPHHKQWYIELTENLVILRNLGPRSRAAIKELDRAPRHRRGPQGRDG